MDGAWLARMRWRRRGAWLWPAFVAAIAADAIIAHALPPSGDSQTLVGAAVLACFLNLIAVVLLSWPIGMALRRLRPDLPRIVARDYGGTTAVVAITLVLLLAGLLHRPSIAADQNAMREAIARAEAWIGDRAPPEFRRNVTRVNTYPIEPGNIYRSCVPSDAHRRSYCVVVKVHMPPQQSIRFDGYESNAVFASGAG